MSTDYSASSTAEARLQPPALRCEGVFSLEHSSNSSSSTAAVVNSVEAAADGAELYLAGWRVSFSGYRDYTNEIVSTASPLAQPSSSAGFGYSAKFVTENGGVCESAADDDVSLEECTALAQTLGASTSTAITRHTDVLVVWRGLTHKRLVAIANHIPVVSPRWLLQVAAVAKQEPRTSGNATATSASRPPPLKEERKNARKRLLLPPDLRSSLDTRSPPPTHSTVSEATGVAHVDAAARASVALTLPPPTPPLLFGYVFCATGLPVHEREALAAVLAHHGAVCADALTARCDALFIGPESAATLAALSRAVAAGELAFPAVSSAPRGSGEPHTAAAMEPPVKSQRRRGREKKIATHAAAVGAVDASPTAQQEACAHVRRVVSDKLRVAWLNDIPVLPYEKFLRMARLSAAVQSIPFAAEHSQAALPLAAPAAAPPVSVDGQRDFDTIVHATQLLPARELRAFLSRQHAAGADGDSTHVNPNSSNSSEIHLCHEDNEGGADFTDKHTPLVAASSVNAEAEAAGSSDHSAGTASPRSSSAATSTAASSVATTVSETSSLDAAALADLLPGAVALHRTGSNSNSSSRSGSNSGAPEHMVPDQELSQRHPVGHEAPFDRWIESTAYAEGEETLQGWICSLPDGHAVVAGAPSVLNTQTADYYSESADAARSAAVPRAGARSAEPPKALPTPVELVRRYYMGLDESNSAAGHRTATTRLARRERLVDALNSDAADVSPLPLARQRLISPLPTDTDPALKDSRTQGACCINADAHSNASAESDGNDEGDAERAGHVAPPLPPSAPPAVFALPFVMACPPFLSVCALGCTGKEWRDAQRMALVCRFLVCPVPTRGTDIVVLGRLGLRKRAYVHHDKRVAAEGAVRPQRRSFGREKKRLTFYEVDYEFAMTLKTLYGIAAHRLAPLAWLRACYQTVQRLAMEEVAHAGDGPVAANASAAKRAENAGTPLLPNKPLAELFETDRPDFHETGSTPTVACIGELGAYGPEACLLPRASQMSSAHAAADVKDRGVALTPSKATTSKCFSCLPPLTEEAMPNPHAAAFRVLVARANDTAAPPQHAPSKTAPLAVIAAASGSLPIQDDGAESTHVRTPSSAVPPAGITQRVKKDEQLASLQHSCPAPRATGRTTSSHTDPALAGATANTTADSEDRELPQQQQQQQQKLPAQQATEADMQGQREATEVLRAYTQLLAPSHNAAATATAAAAPQAPLAMSSRRYAAVFQHCVLCFTDGSFARPHLGAVRGLVKLGGGAHLKRTDAQWRGLLVRRSAAPDEVLPHAAGEQEAAVQMTSRVGKRKCDILGSLLAVMPSDTGGPRLVDGEREGEEEETHAAAALSRPASWCRADGAPLSVKAVRKLHASVAAMQQSGLLALRIVPHEEEEEETAAPRTPHSPLAPTAASSTALHSKSSSALRYLPTVTTTYVLFCLACGHLASPASCFVFHESIPTALGALRQRQANLLAARKAGGDGVAVAPQPSAWLRERRYMKANTVGVSVYFLWILPPSALPTEVASTMGGAGLVGADEPPAELLAEETALARRVLLHALTRLVAALGGNVCEHYDSQTVTHAVVVDLAAILRSSIEGAFPYSPPTAATAAAAHASDGLPATVLWPSADAVAAARDAAARVVSVLSLDWLQESMRWHIFTAERDQESGTSRDSAFAVPDLDSLLARTTSVLAERAQTRPGRLGTQDDGAKGLQRTPPLRGVDSNHSSNGSLPPSPLTAAAVSAFNFRTPGSTPVAQRQRLETTAERASALRLTDGESHRHAAPYPWSTSPLPGTCERTPLPLQREWPVPANSPLPSQVGISSQVTQSSVGSARRPRTLREASVRAASYRPPAPADERVGGVEAEWGCPDGLPHSQAVQASPAPSMDLLMECGRSVANPSPSPSSSRRHAHSRPRGQHSLLSPVETMHRRASAVKGAAAESPCGTEELARSTPAAALAETSVYRRSSAPPPRLVLASSDSSLSAPPLQDDAAGQAGESGRKHHTNDSAPPRGSKRERPDDGLCPPTAVGCARSPPSSAASAESRGGSRSLPPAREGDPALSACATVLAACSYQCSAQAVEGTASVSGKHPLVAGDCASGHPRSTRLLGGSSLLASTGASQHVSEHPHRLQQQQQQQSWEEAERVLQHRELVDVPMDAVAQENSPRGSADTSDAEGSGQREGGDGAEHHPQRPRLGKSSSLSPSPVPCAAAARDPLLTATGVVVDVDAEPDVADDGAVHAGNSLAVNKDFAGKTRVRSPIPVPPVPMSSCSVADDALAVYILSDLPHRDALLMDYARAVRALPPTLPVEAASTARPPRDADSSRKRPRSSSSDAQLTADGDRRAAANAGPFRIVSQLRDADCLVAHEVSLRESVLAAVAAGLWVVRPSFLQAVAQHTRRHRRCDEFVGKHSPALQRMLSLHEWSAAASGANHSDSRSVGDARAASLPLVPSTVREWSAALAAQCQRRRLARQRALTLERLRVGEDSGGSSGGAGENTALRLSGRDRTVGGLFSGQRFALLLPASGWTAEDERLAAEQRAPDKTCSRPTAPSTCVARADKREGSVEEPAALLRHRRRTADSLAHIIASGGGELGAVKEFAVTQPAPRRNVPGADALSTLAPSPVCYPTQHAVVSSLASAIVQAILSVQETLSGCGAPARSAREYQLVVLIDTDSLPTAAADPLCDDSRTATAAAAATVACTAVWLRRFLHGACGAEDASTSPDGWTLTDIVDSARAARDYVLEQRSSLEWASVVERPAHSPHDAAARAATNTFSPSVFFARPSRGPSPVVSVRPLALVPAAARGHSPPPTAQSHNFPSPASLSHRPRAQSLLRELLQARARSGSTAPLGPATASKKATLPSAAAMTPRTIVFKSVNALAFEIAGLSSTDAEVVDEDEAQSTPLYLGAIQL